MQSSEGAPEAGEKHRVEARRLAESIARYLWWAGTRDRTLCSECDELWTAHEDGCHVPEAIESMFNFSVIALARVEAETRREFDDERAALRAVLTPLRELAAKATPPPWTPPADLKGGENAVPVSTSGTGMIVKAYGRPHSTNDGTRVIKFQEMRGNAELICALRNALPALLNALAPEPVAGDAPPKHEPSS